MCQKVFTRVTLFIVYKCTHKSYNVHINLLKISKKSTIAIFEIRNLSRVINDFSIRFSKQEMYKYHIKILCYNEIVWLRYI